MGVIQSRFHIGGLMETSGRFSRRQTLLGTLGVFAGAGLLSNLSLADEAALADGPAITKGRLKQTICAWCFDKKLPIDQLCAVAVKLGYKGIDLVEPKQDVLDLLKKHNLTGSMVKSHSIP